VAAADFIDALGAVPLIAILRGISARDAPGIATALLEGGVRCLEIPLNSPSPLESLAAVRASAGERVVLGAGTVLSPEEVRAAAAAGAQFIVSPNTDPAVIAETRRVGLWSLPGFFTASEAFSAIAAGADALKLFPAETAGPAMLKALRAVLPKSVAVLPVGGITPAALPVWRAAGARAFGIGSALYRPGDDPQQVEKQARAFVTAWKG
jgi:2-dehydro-3-deoxyphosphogalactonate aldolase